MVLQYQVVVEEDLVEQEDLRQVIQVVVEAKEDHQEVLEEEVQGVEA